MLEARRLRLTTIAENTSTGTGLVGEWGLSILVEDGEHRFLLDTGAGTTTLANADTLGVDLKGIDAIVLSHGHSDHTGGLLPILSRLKSDVRVVAHPAVFGPKYAKNKKTNKYSYAGVPYARRIYGVPVRQRADITICSAYPGDADFIQVTKAIWAGDKMTCTGGDLIIVTPCTEGVGPYSLMPAFMAQDQRELAKQIRSGEVPANFEGVTAALAVRVNRLGERVRLSLVTEGMSAEMAQQMGISRYTSVEAAQEAAFVRQGPSAKVSVMTQGCYTYPLAPGEYD